jgi:hypothetical protein
MLRNKTKMLIIKLSIGAVTAAVIGMIIKAEAQALDEIEEKYFPPKNEEKKETS